MNHHPAQTLIDLVKIYSPSGSEAPAVEYLVERMLRLGFSRAYRDAAGNAVGVMGAGPRQIVLLGHIDTVSGEIPLRIEAQENGEILHGRGSVDAKGPLAVFVDATAQTGPLDGWQVVVIGAVDEERDSSGTRYILEQYQPDYAIIGEPSRWQRVTLGYKGSAQTAITLRRELAHTASQAESASEAAFHAWERVRKWMREFNTSRERAFDQLLVSLQGLASGKDGFQEWAQLQIGARLPVDISPSAWYAQLKSLLPEAEIKTLSYPIPAFRGEKNTPLVRAFLAGIRAEGGQPGFVLKTGTADLNIVAPHWGCPAVAYGPGDSTLDHTPHEHLWLPEYLAAVNVLRTVLRLIAGVS